MYNPHPYQIEDKQEALAMMRACGLATLVTNTGQDLIATPLPMFLEAEEGEYGVLYGHIARANSQWKEAAQQDGLVIFQGPDAYITPTWYPSKAATGRVVPTWNYIAVHAYGPVEFFHEADRLLQVVSRLTNLHEHSREKSWSVEDAPAEFIEGQLRAIVGIRIPIRRIDAKKKLSQRSSADDRAGVKAGLGSSPLAGDTDVAALIPE